MHVQALKTLLKILKLFLNSIFSKISYNFSMLNKLLEQKGGKNPPIFVVDTTKRLQTLQKANRSAAWYTLGERGKDKSVVAERKKGHYYPIL